MEIILKAIGVIFVGTAGVIVLIPLAVVFGYVTGWILSLIVGDWICSGLNILFGTTRFQPQHLPAICAALSVVSGYLRTSVKHDKD